MIFDKILKKENKRFYYAAFFPAIICLLMVLVFLLEKGMGWDFAKFGIEPRDIKSLPYLFFTPFIHANLEHLVNNVAAFFVLGLCLCYFYSPIANKVMLYSIVLSGVLLWLIGRESYHIGASGVIFSFSFFLFFSGIIRKQVPLIAIALVVVFLYGNNVWHLFPWTPNDPVSWEGHLSGGIIGTFLAFLFWKKEPQKPNEDEWDDELDDEEDKKEWMTEESDV